MNKIISKLFVTAGSQLPEIKENEIFFIIYITSTKVFFSIIDQSLVDKERTKLVDDLLPGVVLSKSTFIFTSEKQPDGSSQYSISQILEKNLPASGLLEDAIPATIDQRGFSCIEDIILYAKELVLQGIIETLKDTMSKQPETDEAKDAMLRLPLNIRVHELLKNYRESDSRELKNGYIQALEIIMNDSAKVIWPST